jgi:hypothetical protein
MDLATLGSFQHWVGTHNFARTAIPPAMLVATFANMGRHIGLDLQTEENQFPNLL